MIQIENQEGARPQSGLSQADIVYEYQTEGGVSRFTAFYFHPPVSAIGPVRSARLVTITLLRIYDATLLFAGANQYVTQLLDSSGLRQFSGQTADGALFRIRTRFPPHNLYTDGNHLAAFERRLGPPQVVGYQLWNRTAIPSLPAGGSPVERFKVPISPYEVPIYTYDPATAAYTRTESTTGQLSDADTNAPWRPATIVVLQVQVTAVPQIVDVVGHHGFDFGLIGRGNGQLAVGGRVYSITWNQGPAGPPQLTLADGQPAPLAPGQVLIELVSQGQVVQPLAPPAR